MSRNKYPEETVQKILDASIHLFLEKGYEQTSIVDIVDQLGGMTRGAFYHHFQSKEAVLHALGNQLLFDSNLFDKAALRHDLTGLQKIRFILGHAYTSEEMQARITLSAHLVTSPAFLQKIIADNRDRLAPLYQVLIEEGVQDGSIHTEHSKHLAELFTFFINFWMTPTLFPTTEAESFEKYLFIKKVTDRMGLPVFE